MPNAKTPIPEARYPEITRLLETEDFNQVNKGFMSAFQQLEKISKMKGLKKASEARKGMKAIERVMDLLRELLRRKYEILGSPGSSPPQGKK
ncbi:MAG: hypothetical protein HY542_05810 [Deltaproteobacteria bacterium]|nr:hypothetical protein [Deltaproteobacteria bacterium]